MSLSSIKSVPVMLPNSEMEKLKQESSGTLDTEKARLRKATKEFESFFMYQMLQTMRKTVPKTSLNEGAPFSGDMGKDVFTDLFDMQMAKDMVTGDKNSLSEILYKSLEKLIEAEYATAGEDFEIRPLKMEPVKPMELNPETAIPLPKNEKTNEIKVNPTEFMPVSSSLKAVKCDQILSRFGSHIDEASKNTSLDPSLIISVIKAESNGDPDAVSSAGAKGLMQLADSTASDYGVKEVFDPKENIEAGSRYLKDLIDRFGSVKLALAAYNAGPTNVMRYGGIPPFKETQAYVKKVLDTLNSFDRTADNAIAKALK